MNQLFIPTLYSWHGPLPCTYLKMTTVCISLSWLPPGQSWSLTHTKGCELSETHERVQSIHTTHIFWMGINLSIYNLSTASYCIISKDKLCRDWIVIWHHTNKIRLGTREHSPTTWVLVRMSLLFLWRNVGDIWMFSLPRAKTYLSWSCYFPFLSCVWALYSIGCSFHSNMRQWFITEYYYY